MLKKVFFLLLLSLIYLPQAAFSQTSPSGITVTPSIIHLDLSQDQPEYSLSYTNNTNAEINLLLSAEDFSELENNYQLKFLDPKDASNYKYSLSSWISFENKNIQLSPHQTKSVKVFVNKDRITKGGHYASILAEIVQPESNKKVDVKGVLSSLLFVRASTGQEIEEGKIIDFKPSRDGIEQPEKYILRFQNSGNVHVVPYGLIQVYDPSGKVVAKGYFNENSLDALPESIRRYETQTIRSKNFLMPGIYRANISLHFGKNNLQLSQNINYFSQGDLDLAKIGLILILILASIFIFRSRQKVG